MKLMRLMNVIGRDTSFKIGVGSIMALFWFINLEILMSEEDYEDYLATVYQ